jgi:hypothetical protein
MMPRYHPTVIILDLEKGEVVNRFMKEDRHVKRDEKSFVLTSGEDSSGASWAFWDNVKGGSTVCKIGISFECESLDVSIGSSDKKESVLSVSLLSPQSENLLILHLAEQKSQVAIPNTDGKLDILREFVSASYPELAFGSNGGYFLGISSPADQV